MKEKITDKKWFIYALVPLCALCWGFSYLGITVTLKSLEPIPVSYTHLTLPTTSRV